MNTGKFDRMVSEEQIIFDEKMKEISGILAKKGKVNLKSAKIELLFLKDTELRKNPLFRGYESYEWVIVKSYYAMYNIARALLAKIGIKTMSHASTLYAFKILYIRRGKIHSRYFRMLDNAKIEEGYLDMIYDARKIRFSAQYDVLSSIIEREAVECLKKAETFVNDLSKMCD